MAGKFKLGLIVITVLAVASALWGWYHPTVDLRVLPIWNEVPQVKEIVKFKRVEVPGPERLVIIEKEKIVKELDLPPQVALDNATQVTAVGEIRHCEDEGKTIVVSTINTETGESKLIEKPVPPPLFKFKNQKELGIRYGFTTQGHEADIFGRWTFLRVGAFHFAVYGELNSQPHAKAMAEATYRW